MLSHAKWFWARARKAWHVDTRRLACFYLWFLNKWRGYLYITFHQVSDLKAIYSTYHSLTNYGLPTWVKQSKEQGRKKSFDFPGNLTTYFRHSVECLASQYSANFQKIITAAQVELLPGIKPRIFCTKVRSINHLANLSPIFTLV